jgi:uridine phosphorylase
MAGTPSFELSFANLEQIGADLAKRVGASGHPNDPVELGRQKVAAAQSRLDVLTQQRTRLEADIAAAQRALQEVSKLAESVAAPKVPTGASTVSSKPEAPTRPVATAAPAKARPAAKSGTPKSKA